MEQMSLMMMLSLEKEKKAIEEATTNDRKRETSEIDLQRYSNKLSDLRLQQLCILHYQRHRPLPLVLTQVEPLLPINDLYYL